MGSSLAHRHPHRGRLRGRDGQAHGGGHGTGVVGLIPCQRHLFDIPDEVAYLNCAYMAPMLTTSLEAGIDGMARKARPWTLPGSAFFDEAEELRALVARLLGAGASVEDVALIPSASYGIGVAAANLPVTADQTIVVLAEQFPSNVYPWRERAAQTGAALVTVARPADRDWTPAVLAAIDERCAVVALPQVHWTDGGLVDLIAVGEAARTVGAGLVVDASQSLGALPLDIAAVRPDFLVSVAYKWLLGPYSLAFLYAAPHHHGGVAIEHNWINRTGAESFSALTEYTDAFTPGARRYDVGERSNFALLPVSLDAIGQILDWGVAEIQTSLRAQTDELCESAGALGIMSAPRDLRCGHLVGLQVPGGAEEALAQNCADAGVHVSIRGGSVRVAPHLYNTSADLDRLLDVLAAGA